VGAGNNKKVDIILKRNYYNYYKLYNELDNDKTVKLIMSLHEKQLQIVNINKPTNIHREIIVIGSINIDKEIKDLNEFVEIIYENHEQGLRFLISKSLNDLKDQGHYKIAYIKFYNEFFYKITSYKEIL